MKFAFRFSGIFDGEVTIESLVFKLQEERIAHRSTEDATYGGTVPRTQRLVNEAYLRLMERRHVSCETPTQFLGVAAQVMRRVLVD